MVISFGLVGPKGMEKSAPDGQQVNIPALLMYAMEGRRVVYKASYGLMYWYRRYRVGKSARLPSMELSQVQVKVWLRPDLVYKAHFREKLLSFNI
jgi:hypothetical protein